jgi:hypothetical protein
MSYLGFVICSAEAAVPKFIHLIAKLSGLEECACCVYNEQRLKGKELSSSKNKIGDFYFLRTIWKEPSLNAPTAQAHRFGLIALVNAGFITAASQMRTLLHLGLERDDESRHTPISCSPSTEHHLQDAYQQRSHAAEC